MLDMRPPKWKCTACGWSGTELLSAPHPFLSEVTIDGCPGCREIGEIVRLCDEPGCLRPSSGGYPDEHGVYRIVCSLHFNWP